MILASCAPPASNSPGPGTAEPTFSVNPTPEVPSVDPASIERWVTFRATYGLRADSAWAIAVAADPRSVNDTGVPLLPWELDAMGDLIRRQHELIDVLRTYGQAHRDVFGGVFVDGPLTVLQMAGDAAEHREALALFLPAGTPYEVRSVRWTSAELRAFASTIKADAAWFASIGAELGDAAPDLPANNVLVDYLAADERASEAILGHFGHPDWMALRYVGPMPWMGRRGTLIVAVTDDAGRPVTHVMCEAVPVDRSIDADTGNAFTTDDQGICRDPDLPASAYKVNVLLLEDGEPRIIGGGEATVPADGTVRIRIVVTP